MITIINDKKYLPASCTKIILTPYERFDTIISITGLTDEIKKIIAEIDSCKTDSGNNLISKFTLTAVDISNVSDGCKTVVAIWYNLLRKNNSEVLNITSCGPNAIKYIFEHYQNENLCLYLNHYDLPQNINCRFLFNNVMLTNTNDIFRE